MRIRGMDFSSVPSRAHPIVIAECRLEADRLVLEELVDVPDLTRFEAALAAPGPWLAAIDFPFGLPRVFVADQGYATSWASYVQWAEALGRKGFEQCLLAYKKHKPDGQKEPLRRTDRLAKSQSPLKLYGVPVAKMFFEGAPRLLGAPVSIPVLRRLDVEQTVVEAYPALVVRHLGAGKYKGVKRGDGADSRRAMRERIVSRLEEGIGAPYEIRVELGTAARHRMIDDWAGDVLDSVLCAVQGAYAARRQGENFGIPADADPLEGWIIGSELALATRRPSESNPSGPLPLVLRAAAFAARKHRDQRRKDASGSPYVNHPIALANILCLEAGIEDPITLAAALLHDTIEDTETAEEELRGEFGDEVASTVMELTDVNWLGKIARKRLQISRAARASHRAKLVKIADKIANLRDILSSPPADWALSRQQEYFDWAKSVVDEVRGANGELERRFDELYRQRPGSNGAS